MLDPQSPALTQHYYYRSVTLSMTGATGFWRVWTSKCLAWGKRWRGSSRWDTRLTLWTGLLLVLLKYPCLVLSRASPAGWLWSEMSVCILGTHQWLQWAAHLVCTSCRLLLIGRICQALTDCCPSLTRLSQGCRRQEARAAARTRRLPSQRKEIEAEKNLTNEMVCQRTALVHRYVH